MTRPIKRVAIIGAGPTGLVQLKNILDTRRLGHRAYELEVVVYESKPDVGGVWFSTEEPKSYKRTVISHSGHNVGKGKQKEGERMYIYPPGHEDPSPMYDGLRTNLPKELMAFRDFPFPEETPLFPDRRMIHKYFQDYATHFSLWPYIRFNTRVDRLYRPERNGQWIIESCPTNADSHGDKAGGREEFDFVCVGNGHYQDGWIPEIPGLSTFQGEILHSIYYLRPEDYASKSILVVGSFASGSDLARQLASLDIGKYDPDGNPLTPTPGEPDGSNTDTEGFTKVYVSCSNPPETNDPWTPYITYLPLISHLDDGDIIFHPSTSTSSSDPMPGSATQGDVLRKGEVDTIIFATGYNFSLPFCKTTDQPWSTPRPSRASDTSNKSDVSGSGEEGHRVLEGVIKPGERAGGREWEVGGMKGLVMEGLDPLMLFLDGDRSIAFPILQYQIVPFPLAETQTRLTALLWSGTIHLPSQSTISADIPRNESNSYSNPSPLKSNVLTPRNGPDDHTDKGTHPRAGLNERNENEGDECGKEKPNGTGAPPGAGKGTRKVVQMRRQLVFGSPYEFQYQEYLMSLMAASSSRQGKESERGAGTGTEVKGGPGDEGHGDEARTGGDDPTWVERWWAAQEIKKRWRADTTLRKRTLGY